MRPLEIDDNLKRRVAEIRQYAEREDKRLTIYMLKKIIEGVDPSMGDDPCRLHMTRFGYGMCYSIEQAMIDGSDDKVWMAHLSVWVNSPPPAAPSPAATNVIAGLFGFPSIFGKDVLISKTTSECIEVNLYRQFQ